MQIFKLESTKLQFFPHPSGLLTDFNSARMAFGPFYRLIFQTLFCHYFFSFRVDCSNYGQAQQEVDVFTIHAFCYR